MVSKIYNRVDIDVLMDDEIIHFCLEKHWLGLF